ncbi:hypothetical protein [Rhodococcus sp. 14C212]|uniref:hypothetical protein n=1 Tax=Rhodococcus sp. 14C212 TaxID=2711209 RepID=UPI001F0FCAFD|nr:hypothetical protein [Rhodococcus sp. 14C212]
MLLLPGSRLARFVTRMLGFRNEQHSHGTDYRPEFFAGSFENRQSEWWQRVFQAILLMGARHWIFKVEAEDMERIERKIDRIQDRLGLPTAPPGSDDGSP